MLIYKIMREFEYDIMIMIIKK